MNILLVHAHPEPLSFSSALAARAREVFTEMNHTVELSDLYAMQFNPVSSRANFSTVLDPAHFKPQAEERHACETGGFAPDLQAEMDKLSRADLLLFNSPLWWFSIPAILKGWIDRVFAAGFAYGAGRIYDKGVFQGKRGMLSLTTGGPEAIYGPGKLNGDMLQLLYPIHHGVFSFCGMQALPPFVAWSAAHVDDAQRMRYLDAFEAHLRAVDSLPPLVF